MKTFLKLLSIAALGVAALTGCSAPESIAVGTDTIIVDVRTAGEFADSHLDGAVNVDVQQADFETRITELPLDGEYIVYCATGNRSGAAVDRMAQLGFTDVTDAGGVSSASASTGIAIVTD